MRGAGVFLSTICEGIAHHRDGTVCGHEKRGGVRSFTPQSSHCLKDLENVILDAYGTPYGLAASGKVLLALEIRAPCSESEVEAARHPAPSGGLPSVFVITPPSVSMMLITLFDRSHRDGGN